MSTAALPAVRIHAREQVIFSFERTADVRRWRPNYISKSPFRAWNERFASKGKGSMAVDLDAGSRYPGILLRAPRGGYIDWSGGETLRFEAFNPQEYPVSLHIRVDSRDAGGRETRNAHEFSLRPGLNRLRLPLRAFGGQRSRIDPARINQVILHTISPEKTVRLYLDEFRLESPAQVDIPVENVFLFDFGPASSPAMPGFRRVAPDDGLTPDTAFGFTAPPLRAGTAAYQLDSLADDYVAAGSADRQTEFAVRLPDGRYSVGLLVQSLDSMGLPSRAWSVKANGKLKQKHGVSGRSFYSTKGYYRGFEIDYGPDTDVWEEFVRQHVPYYQFEAEVTDGLLRVAFDSCSAYAMMVWPAEHNDWGGRLVRQVQQARKREFYDYNYWQEPAAEAEAPAEAVLAPVSYLRDVAPDFVPHRAEPVCSVSAAPGETEPVALAFRAPVEYRNIAIRATDLVGEAGVVSAAAADVRLAKLFPKGKRGVYELVPVMLVPAGGQTLHANVTREIWVDLHVPGDAAPGVYHGTVTVEAEGRAPVSADLALTVRPFRLNDDLPVGFGMFYGKPARFNGHYVTFYGGWEKWEQAVEAELKNMRDHGFNTLSIAAPKYVGMRDGVPELDFSWRDRLVRLCRKHGLARRHPALTSVMIYAYKLINQEGLTEFSPEFNRAFLDACRQVLEWAGKNDLPILIQVVDEPREFDVAWWNRNLADTHRYLDLFESLPKARTFITFTAAEKHGADYSSLAPRLDVVAVHPREHSRKLVQRAREVCIYNAGRNRLSWGFYLWKTGARSRREWGYRWINQPYNPFDPANAAVVYPSPEGLLPTIDEKRIREGIDDYRYIYTLQTRMAEAGASGRDVSSASALLDEIRGGLPDYFNAGSPGSGDLDYPLDDWRGRIADEIGKLTDR